MDIIGWLESHDTCCTQLDLLSFQLWNWNSPPALHIMLYSALRSSYSEVQCNGLFFIVTSLVGWGPLLFYWIPLCCTTTGFIYCTENDRYSVFMIEVKIIHILCCVMYVYSLVSITREKANHNQLSLNSLKQPELAWISNYWTIECEQFFWVKGQFSNSCWKVTNSDGVRVMPMMVMVIKKSARGRVNTYLIFVTGTTGSACVKKIAQCRFLQI